LGWMFERELEAWRFIARARRIEEQLAELYAPLVRAEARKVCAKRRIPFDEVQGAEFDGFRRAAKNYDPSRGTPFEAFLKLHIRGAVLDFARANERRPCRHGDKPRFELDPLGDVGEATLGREDADHISEIEELLGKVISRLSSPIRRNLFVLCAVVGRPCVDVAHELGIDVYAAEAELEVAMHEAADAVKVLGLVDAGLMNANPSMYRLRKRSGVQLLKNDKLCEIGARALVASRKHATLDDTEARTLVGTCNACGAEVLGPKGIHGPIPMTCACGNRVDVS